MISGSFILPSFDERYIDYGMNKLIWIYQLRERNYTFRVLLHSFVVHVPHPSTRYDGHMRSRRVQGRLTDMDLLMKGYIADLKQRNIRLKEMLPLCEGAKESFLFDQLGVYD